MRVLTGVALLGLAVVTTAQAAEPSRLYPNEKLRVTLTGSRVLRVVVPGADPEEPGPRVGLLKGARVVGRLLASEAGELVLDLDDGPVVRIPPSQIARVERGVFKRTDGHLATIGAVIGFGVGAYFGGNFLVSEQEGGTFSSSAAILGGSLLAIPGALAGKLCGMAAEAELLTWEPVRNVVALRLEPQPLMRGAAVKLVVRF